MAPSERALVNLSCFKQSYEAALQLFCSANNVRGQIWSLDNLDLRFDFFFENQDVSQLELLSQVGRFILRDHSGLRQGNKESIQNNS